MRSIGYPELLVRDLKPDESNELLRTIYAAVTNGKKNSLEINIADIFKPKLSLVDLTEDTTKEIFYACRAYYGDWIFNANEIRSRLLYAGCHRVSKQFSSRFLSAVLRATDFDNG